MKCKGDFVTNSSSVSFILGQLKEYNPLKIEVKVSVDLSRYVEEEFHTLKDFEEAMSNDDTWYTDEEQKQMRSILEKGGKVFILDVEDQSGDPIEAMLCQEGLDVIEIPDGLVVIRGEGGY